ncbi:hypothetical protein D0T53_11425 [Dysgonomonas sp. 216]|uniref:TatD family hydrolase n=1 Tax=Dysgonomonas sp. 216 TaxID=2302934 RepID=UPI0013D62DAB|nr:TatD family hydrolase [Dysgonomonas sp. 216]NDW19516.1 hypothetical protein [Dysgonomonas sp. 216]
MDLYDIHTHDSSSTSADEGEPSHPYILNVYPLGFEDAKDALLGCSFSCGVHPWYSENAEPQLKFLSEIAGDSRIVAIGEAGYDKLKGPELSIQQHVFEYQISLSEKLKKPLIIHCVKAWDELIASKKKFNPKQAWIIHGYKGKPELTKQLLAHGFMFSVNDKFNIDSVKVIPLNMMFCETDTHDISIESVYEILADALEMPIENLTEKLENNIARTFPQLITVNVS